MLVIEMLQRRPDHAAEVGAKSGGEEQRPERSLGGGTQLDGKLHEEKPAATGPPLSAKRCAIR